MTTKTNGKTKPNGKPNGKPKTEYELTPAQQEGWAPTPRSVSDDRDDENELQVLYYERFSDFRGGVLMAAAVNYDTNTPADARYELDRIAERLGFLFHSLKRWHKAKERADIQARILEQIDGERSPWSRNRISTQANKAKATKRNAINELAA